MIGNHPNLAEHTWSGTVELDLGDLGSWDADLEISYTTDGNAWARGEHKCTTYATTVDGQSVQIDLTDSITESALDDLMEQYIVNG